MGVLTYFLTYFVTLVQNRFSDQAIEKDAPHGPCQNLFARKKSKERGGMSNGTNCKPIQSIAS